MLKLIIGRAGSGKTQRAHSLICEMTEQGERPILLVPEQFSFESERAMLQKLGAANAEKVEVYSFSRLAEQLARQLGGCAGSRIDDCGRAAAMTVALSQLQGQLTLYKSERTATYIDHLLDAVKEFKVCGITAQQLAETSHKADAMGSLSNKLHELSLIYAAYEAVVARAYIDPMDDLDRLAKHLDEVDFFADRPVVMDSFRGFTGQELRVIERIMVGAPQCVITLCADSDSGSSDDAGLFSTTQATIDQLKRLAKERDVEMAESEILEATPRFKTEALSSLERNLLRVGSGSKAYEAVDKNGERITEESITLYCAENRYDEAEFCARESRRLLREEGYVCSDITVIARAADAYTELVADAMELQGIPCFIDRRVDITDSTLIQFVLAALDASQSRQTETLLRLVKTGMIDGISDTAIDLLENYCFVWDVRGSAWREPFTENPDGYSETVTEEQQNRLQIINEARERVNALIGRFCERMTTSDGREMAAALYMLLDEAGAAKRLGMLCKTIPSAYAEEQAQIWDALMGLLDQIAALTAETSMQKENFCALMAMMINRCDIGHIPQSLDEVTFGAADRIRATEPRAVFVLGAVDGEFPATPTGTGVFTDDERSRLRHKLGLQVAEPIERKLLEERLLVYTTLCSARERLYLTYTKAESGRSDELGECVSEVLACVPGAKCLHHQENLTLELIENETAAFELAARHMNENTPLAASLINSIEQRKSFADRMKAVKRAVDGTLPTLSSESAVREMLGDSLRISASQLEKYARCPFMYLCQYGYRLKAPRRAKLGALENGNVTHYVLENFFVENKDVPFEDIANDIEGVREKTAILLERYLEQFMGGAKGKLASLLSKLRGMKDSLSLLIINIAKEFSVSDFRMNGFELGIHPHEDVKPVPIRSENGTEITVIGKIDRVDDCDIAGVRYVRVVDYKTGMKSFKLEDVYNGLSLQMLIYLDQLCSAEEGRFKGSVPAGVLYMPAYSGTLETESSDIVTEKIESKRDSSLKRKGMLIDDENFAVCRAMEKDMEGIFIPARITKSNTLDKNKSNVYTHEDYDVIRAYVRWMIGYTAERMLEGRFEPSPLQDARLACEQCDYFAICRYEGIARSKIKSEDVLSQMTLRMNGQTEEVDTNE